MCDVQKDINENLSTKENRSKFKQSITNHELG